jgi:peptide/nickel transport system permease protein
MMGKILDGSLESYSNRTNVREELIRGIPATTSLVMGAAILWLVFGIAFGILSALYAGRWPDKLITAIAMLGISLPVFWIGALMLYYLTYKVQLFPAGGYVELTEDPASWFSHLILPCVALSILFIGFYSRLLRSNMLDVMGEDHVRAARAKGLPERRVVTHLVLRNSLIPMVTIFGLDFAAAFGGGAILTESVFGLQGVGLYVADSVGNLDLPPIMATTLYGAFFIVLFSAIVDIAYAWLDPRVRLNA